VKLDSEFYRMPLWFDVARMIEEVAAFKEHEWRNHPSDYTGNTALILISRNGEQNDDFVGPMKPVPAIELCPYIKQVLASLKTVFGRSRLMRLAPHSEVPRHADINYHWKNRVRIHVPIITHPDIQFVCGEKSVHMAAGEAWIFDAWKQHTVINPTDVLRVHLVADTSGTPEFWRMVENSEKPFDSGQQNISESKFIPFEPEKQVSLVCEQFTHPAIMSPGEVDALIMDLISESVGGQQREVDAFIQLLHRFRQYWRCAWQTYGPTEQGVRHFQTIIEGARAQLVNFPSVILRSNGSDAANVFTSWVLNWALTVDRYPDSRTTVRSASS